MKARKHNLKPIPCLTLVALQTWPMLRYEGVGRLQGFMLPLCAVGISDYKSPSQDQSCLPPGASSSTSSTRK